MGNITSDTGLQFQTHNHSISIHSQLTPVYDIPKILGGLPSTLGEFPYQVYFEGKIGNDTRHCSGAILSSVLILTAAHCVYDSYEEDWEVTAGLVSDDEDEHVQVKRVVKMFIHDDFNKIRWMENDIAILVLSSKLELNKFVSPISIYKGADDVKHGTNATAAGWGKTLIANISRTLLKVNVPVTSCSGRQESYTLPETMLCAGNAQSDVCKGDSGAALTMPSESGERVIIGIASYGEQCTESQSKPGVYTNVGKYQEWIMDVMQRHNASRCGPSTFYCIGEDKCLPIFKYCDRIMDCADGADENLENGCTPCPANQFRCPGSETCLPNTARCDGIADCPSGVDEAGCSYCSNNLFRCPNSTKCIPKQAQCDGIPDCPDAQDELHCTTCTRNRYRCPDSSICLPRNAVCDGEPNCPGQEDEVGCRICSDGRYRCPGTTRCIDSNKHCDGVIDCPMGRDETNCTTCTNNRYRCAGSIACINLSQKCDGVLDCPMGDDEGSDCTFCTLDRIRCPGYLKCIEKNQTCDGELDCPDGFDEYGCNSCTKNRFRCKGELSTCLPLEKKCDGVEDCEDGSDEDNCTACIGEDFRCPGTRICIPERRKCDQIPDCPNEEDEDSCHFTIRRNRLPGQPKIQFVMPKEADKFVEEFKATLGPALVGELPKIWENITKKPIQIVEEVKREGGNVWKKVNGWFSG